MADVQIKGKIVLDTGNAAPQVDNLKKKLGDAGAAGKGAQGSFANLKKELGGMAEGMAMGGQSAGLLNNALNLLRANPIVGVIVLLAGAVVGLVNKFRQMEGVSDSLSKAWASLSTIVGRFTTAILAPLIDGFTAVVEWGTKAAEYLVGLFAPNLAKAGKEAGKLAEELDNLEDAERNNEVARARSMRQMAEAREIAEDANVPIKQRIAALKEAAAIERQLLEESIQNNIKHARAIIAQTALKIGATQQEINMIKAANAAQLERVRIQLAGRAEVNQVELNASIEYIKNAEQLGTDLANMERKTQKRITAIDKEEQDKRIAKAQEAYEKKKALLDKERKDREDFEEQQRQDWEAAAEYERQLDAERIAEEDRKQAEEEARMQAQHQRQLARVSQHEDELAEQEERRLKKKNEAENQALQNDKVRADLRVQLAQQVMNGLGALADLVGRQTKLGKVLALAEIATGTAVGFIQGLDIAQKSSKGTGPAAAFAFPIFYATQIAAVLGAVAKAKSALASSPGGSGGSFSVSAPKVDAPMNPIPVSNATTLDRDTINQIGNAARGGTQRAYVLSGDVNSENERNARIERAARLG